MKSGGWGLVVFILAGIAVSPLTVIADTIAPGEIRVVEGTVTAVDVAYRAMVIDVPTNKGPLTVGVTLAASVEPKVDGRTISLSDVAIGERSVVRYTRENGHLVGLDVRVRR